MDLKSTYQFARKVGFGLGEQELPPVDPVAWAQAQLDKAPMMGFPANLRGESLSGISPNVRLLQTQEETVAAMRFYGEAEDASQAASRTMSRDAWDKFKYETFEYPVWNLEPWKEVLARAAMAVNGPAPVFERFWHFWTNHFTVAPGNNRNEMAIGPYMRMLRGHMQGNFRDMLFEAITHPAMVLYLDNNRNTGPNSKARRKGWTTDEINENLGREMLELFSLSPAAGYTQSDVQAAALILTGWGVNGHNKWAKTDIQMGSYFDFDRHEPGTQTVLGNRYSAAIHFDAKLKDLIDDLAAHPATAAHIARKLATAFLSDEPDSQAIGRLAKVFQTTKGHLPTLHKAVVAEVSAAGPAARKFQDPQTWLWTLFRTTGVPLAVAPPLRGTNGERYHWLLADLGQPIHQCPQPNGWSLFSRDWISGEMLDRRVRYAMEFSRRIENPQERLRKILERHEGLDSTLASQLLESSLSPGDRWAAYLASPRMLWS